MGRAQVQTLAATTSEPPNPSSMGAGVSSPTGERKPPSASLAPAEQGMSPMTPIEFVSPPSNIDVYVDAFPDDEEV